MKAAKVNKIRFLSSVITFSSVLLFGIVFLVFFLIFNKPVPENYVATTATIVRIEEELSPGYDESDGLGPEDYEHSVFIEYTYQGVVYSEIEYGNYSSSMKEGDTVLIYLNPASPDEFMSDPKDQIVFMLIGIGIILVGIGGLGFSIYKKKKGDF